MNHAKILILAALTLAATCTWAASHTVNVLPPNGTDDTANIQAALDTCVAHGPGCTVQLAAGKYLTRQLVAYDFQGSFKGMGMGSTTIQALYPLPVSIPDPITNGECLPNTTTCLWPSLIIFVDGNISVSDLAILITAPPGMATEKWTVYGLQMSSLLDGLRFMGQHPTDVSIDHISIEGLPDNSAYSFGIQVGFGIGFNVVNEIIFTGELPRSSTPFNYYLMSGSLTVRNSFFKSAIDGVSQDGFLHSSQITIGGSPSAGNRFENLYVGMDLEGSEGSFFNVSNNDSSGIYYSMWVVPWQPVFVPKSPSRYLIHDNQFVTTAAGAAGIFLSDSSTNPWIQATIWNNRIELQDVMSDGIDATNTKNTAVLNNAIAGSGYDAIGLRGSTSSVLLGNDLSGYTPDSTAGLADIYLDPSTSHDLVVCAQSSDSVLNLGTKNVVIGCK
jgi:hypothetical protein